MRMKIIHVTDELKPEAGGLVSVPINLAAAQAALGHEVFLLGRMGIENLIHSGETSKIPDFDRVTMEDAGQPGLAAKIAPTKVRKLLIKHITPGSIVHLHGVWDPILLVASQIARKVGATYIVTPHSMLHPWQMQRFTWQKKVVFALGWKRMLKSAAFVHVLNSDEKTYVDAFKLGTPTEIIANGIYPESLLPPQNMPFRNKHAKLLSSPYILFLSRLHNQKGILHLLDGFEVFFQSHPDVYLVLGGPDYGELSLIEQKLKGMKSSSHVVIPGPLYGEEKLDALHGAQCFALTSLNEGFSVAILEALACGLPVVISSNCFFPEVEEAGAGIISALDSTSVSNALASLLDHPEKQQQMGQIARQLVEQSYHWSSIAKQTEVLYEKYSNL